MIRNGLGLKAPNGDDNAADPQYRFRVARPHSRWALRRQANEDQRHRPEFWNLEGALDEGLNDLSQNGYLETVRGRNGGIRLMREPRHINIGQVVRDTENQLGVIGCLERRGYCPIERACVLRSALQDATRAFLAVLDAYTLADLTKPKRALSSLLFKYFELGGGLS